MVFPDETFDGLAAAADEPARPKSVSTPKAAPAIAGRVQKTSLTEAKPASDSAVAKKKAKKGPGLKIVK